MRFEGKGRGEERLCAATGGGGAKLHGKGAASAENYREFDSEKVDWADSLTELVRGGRGRGRGGEVRLPVVILDCLKQALAIYVVVNFILPGQFAQ